MIWVDSDDRSHSSKKVIGKKMFFTTNFFFDWPISVDCVHLTINRYINQLMIQLGCNLYTLKKIGEKCWTIWLLATIISCRVSTIGSIFYIYIYTHSLVSIIWILMDLPILNILLDSAHLEETLLKLKLEVTSGRDSKHTYTQTDKRLWMQSNMTK